MTAIELAVRKALAKLMTAFRQDIEETDETALVYLEALRDLEPLDIDGGVVRVIRGERYFPRPAILRAYALEERTARTVMVRPLIHSGDDILCSLCGATGVWLRSVTNDRGTFERIETSHKYECPVKREDQPSLVLTKGAA